MRGECIGGLQTGRLLIPPVSMQIAIMWFRQDLRVEDHAALAYARDQGFRIMPIFIWDGAGEAGWVPGGASRWWLHGALLDLGRATGGTLRLFVGDSAEVLAELVGKTGATAVFWTRRYEPAVIQRDTNLKRALGLLGVEARSFNNTLLFEPHTVATGQGSPYQVYTPFWRQVSQRPISGPVDSAVEPNRWVAAPGGMADGVAGLELLPSIPWDAGMRASWDISQAGVRTVLEEWLQERLDRYAVARDYPAVRGTSRISPYLHWGQVGPRRVWAAACAVMQQRGLQDETFLKELVWREFAYHILYHFPRTTQSPLREKYDAFPWVDDAGALRAWQRGATGYPIVDAGMRELWHTGWMHNRVRMVVASFLVKHLLLDWRLGAAWFWDTLVDADLASNTMGWQWAAGCGADAAPYFRIFNPVTQGQKFDAEGVYVRKWVPELRALPDRFLHAPWTAPASVLEHCGIRLGDTYPAPIVDHAFARQRALAALSQVSGAGQ